MAHPLCGKCHSAGVYKDYDAEGQPVIACIICGNRYPGGKEGFYMSGKAERPIEEKKVEAAALPSVSAVIESSRRRICITCGLKPTISDSCPFCPSCMRKKSMESRKGKTAPVQARRKETKNDKHHAEKVPLSENSAVNIDFGRFPLILKQLQNLADEEIRPFDLQVIYILKHHLDAIKPSSKAV